MLLRNSVVERGLEFIIPRLKSIHLFVWSMSSNMFFNKISKAYYIYAHAFPLSLSCENLKVCTLHFFSLSWDMKSNIFRDFTSE